MFKLNGDARQQEILQAGIDDCDFPFDELAPSLAKEGKTAIDVSWEDLSRYSAKLEQKTADDHQHFHDGDAELSPVIREVEGRARVLGLFYLPPYTRIVLDNSLVNSPTLAQEVFLAEAAHAVDYHYMDNDMRLAVWNALHVAEHDLKQGDTVHESGDLGHGHSWFDGPSGYGTWVGEAFMEAFVKSFAPNVPVTIHLDHPVSHEAALQIREALLPKPPKPPLPDGLRTALERFLGTKGCPDYLRQAAYKAL